MSSSSQYEYNYRVTQLIDQVYNPIRDNISLLFRAPHLGAVVSFEVDKDADLTKKITELKHKIARGDIS